MTALIPATYENGSFKPLTPVKMPEHFKFILAISPAGDDLPTILLDRLAEQSPSFAFLKNPEEDLYTLKDGEPC